MNADRKYPPETDGWNDEQKRIFDEFMDSESSLQPSRRGLAIMVNRIAAAAVPPPEKVDVEREAEELMSSARRTDEGGIILYEEDIRGLVKRIDRRDLGDRWLGDVIDGALRGCKNSVEEWWSIARAVRDACSAPEVKLREIGQRRPEGEYEKLYHELILEVVNVFPGMTRHERARSIIHDHEQPQNNPPTQRKLNEKEKS